MKKLGTSALVLIIVSAVSILSMGFDKTFDPTKVSKPTSASEAQSLAKDTIYYYTNQYPDNITCSETDDGTAYKCIAYKNGYDDQYLYVEKG